MGIQLDARGARGSARQLASLLKRTAIRLMNDERGQSTTEYILILSVVVLVALRFKSKFETVLNSTVDNLGDKINSALQDTNN